MINDNKQDELIFDFLEGNLSPDEEEAFRILQEESEMFSREVRLWQNTYLEEALPSIKSLEGKLLTYANGNTGNFLSRMYTFLVVLFVYLAIPGDSNLKSISDTFVRPNPISKKSEQNFNTTFDCPKEEHDNIVKIISKERQRTTKEWRESKYESTVLSDLKPKWSFSPEGITLQKIEVIKTEAHRPSRLYIKKWSKREMRQIRQKLWQDNRARKAAEFMKGNVPYVVPLNSNNF